MTLKSHQMGITLIEVLITLIVISFATVGAAILQLQAIQANHSAYLNTQATVLAHDMSERMRANPAGAEAESYHLPTAANITSCYDATAGCNQDEMAQTDMYEWAGDHANSSIKQHLPSGSAVVCIDSTPNDGNVSTPSCDKIGDIYAIKVWWQEKSGDVMQTTITSKFN